MQDDGTCQPSKTSIEVLKRSPLALTQAERQKLEPVAERLCFSPSDFKAVEQTGKVAE